MAEYDKPGQRVATRMATVAELLQGFCAGSLSPVEVVESALERIAEIDPVLHAFLAIDVPGAMDATRASEERYAAGTAGPLDGIPVAIKDTIEVAGMPTTLGSLALAGHQAGDSLVAERLRACGAVIVGKTNTPEFALGPRTRNRLGPEGTNPWDTSRTCGGSSGGSAAAVAAGMVPLAVGTDSAGSIRLPAAYNGVTGIKPTYGRIPAAQAWRGAPGRSHLGLFAADTSDLGHALEALAGRDERDPASRMAPLATSAEPLQADGLKVAVIISGEANAGWWETDMLRGLAEAITERVGTVSILETDIFGRPPDVGRETGTWLYACEQFEAAEAVRPGFMERHRDDLYDSTRIIFDHGEVQLARDYRRGVRSVASYGVEVAQLIASYDVAITPIAGPAPRLDEEVSGSRYVWAFNVTGAPAVAVPWQSDQQTGLPLAVQVVAHHGQDLTALAVASVVEELASSERLPFARN